MKSHLALLAASETANATKLPSMRTPALSKPTLAEYVSKAAPGKLRPGLKVYTYQKKLPAKSRIIVKIFTAFGMR
ncbi:MAG: hypothetical protein E2590_03725 [Chryseobacterium sp.]|nr:hypothetical protein [Chryseobacterium sp.]